MPAGIRGAPAATTIRLDAEGRIATWPDTAMHLFGRVDAAVLGQPLSTLVVTHQRGGCDNVMAHLSRDAAPGAVHTMELVAERTDGSTFQVECSLWRRDASSETPGFDVLLRDITDRMRVEHDLRDELRELRRASASQLQQLRRTQALFIDITETIDEVFWVADAAITRMLYISPGYERIWGRSCASLYDDPRSFMEAIHPDDRERVLADLLVQRDSLPFEHEYRIVRPDGAVIWVRDRGFPVRSPDGTVDRYIGVAQDVTNRKITDAALRRQETLDAIGHMTGGLAHDFNNVLGVIVGHLDLISLEVEPGSEARSSVDQALDAALRGARLARRLLALARREPGERRAIALGSAVQELRALLQHAAGPATHLAVQIHADPVVSVDPGQLDAALLNLAVNARAAMPDGGTLTIDVDEIALGPQAAADYSVPPGPYASLVVGDTGIGMAEDVLRRLGEPFFTTRAEREGTGLGVSMIHAFVRQSGGVMRVDSRPGAGSRFRLLLPVAVGVAPEPTAPASRELEASLGKAVAP